ncbi:hypothetical protein PPACK8108_LOCUS3641 [Phakopsora pachyrhizi]|uniref:Uncharacterized protein n=1 Tax=Phakopsora pachyrhizi TaxID=170000 RepID=A0AAV0ALN5_PHAPC|nr:hypothetical protein PPACK8108_LOCUS3641 [Phakopsora pachyrhizi]
MPSEFSPPDDFAILAPFDNSGLRQGLAKADHPRHVQSAYQLHVVVEDLVKRVGGKEVKGGLQERCKEVFEEGVAVEGNRWCHWKEEQKLGGGAHQGQSGWSKTTGATDL